MVRKCRTIACVARDDVVIVAIATRVANSDKRFGPRIVSKLKYHIAIGGTKFDPAFTRNRFACNSTAQAVGLCAVCDLQLSGICHITLGKPTDDFVTAIDTRGILGVNLVWSLAVLSST